MAPWLIENIAKEAEMVVDDEKTAVHMVVVNKSSMECGTKYHSCRFVTNEQAEEYITKIATRKTRETEEKRRLEEGYLR